MVGAAGHAFVQCGRRTCVHTGPWTAPRPGGEGAAGGDTTEAHSVVCLNQMNLADLKLKPNGPGGYSLIVEGVMPYNTAEGQLVIDTLSNSESFALQEVV